MSSVHARVPTPDEYVRLRSSVGWPSPDPDRCARALASTVFAVTAEDDTGRAVGMGRVVGDGLYLFVVDVAVEPAAQGTGLGGRIVDVLTEWVAASGAPHVALAAEPGVAPVYRRRGFADEPSVYMRLRG